MLKSKDLSFNHLKNKKNIKGIILAGGLGSRLTPLTLCTSKQLLPVFDKPMIYYPLSTLMENGIKDIIIISSAEYLINYKHLFGDGNKLGLNISYAVQNKPNGIAEAFIIASDFISNDNVVLILGDNIFYGNSLKNSFKMATENLNQGLSSIFGVKVKNPQAFGVINFDKTGNVKSIIEKPKKYYSDYVVSGLYFYPNEVVLYSKKLIPSKRNELEITDINNKFLKERKLKLIKLKSDVKWIDTGTFDSLIKASKFFQDIFNKSGKRISCLEEIALKYNFITISELDRNISELGDSHYKKYLIEVSNKYKNEN